MVPATFDAGHFHKHNEDVLKDISDHKTVKESVKSYINHAIADGKALVDAGASPEQIKSSLQALSDQFETKAWLAIVKNTNHKD